MALLGWKEMEDEGPVLIYNRYWHYCYCYNFYYQYYVGDEDEIHSA